MDTKGAERDQEKHSRTNTAVLCEANLCCSGQPVLLMGDLDLDHPFFGKRHLGWEMGRLGKSRLPPDVEKPLLPHAGCSWMKVMALAETLSCFAPLVYRRLRHVGSSLTAGSIHISLPSVLGMPRSVRIAPFPLSGPPAGFSVRIALGTPPVKR